MDVDLHHPRPARVVSLAAALFSAALATLAIAASALGAPSAGTIAVAASSNASSSYTPSASNLEGREWFQDARFGIFLHCGLYSELGGVGTPPASGTGSSCCRNRPNRGRDASPCGAALPPFAVARQPGTFRVLLGSGLVNNLDTVA